MLTSKKANWDKEKVLDILNGALFPFKDSHKHGARAIPNLSLPSEEGKMNAETKPFIFSTFDIWW